MRIAVVIPARLASTRFPRKLLADLHGKPVLRWTWEAACRAHLPERVVIAVDGMELAEAAAAWGATVITTSSHHASGTDRVAEVARGLEVDALVNVQGDEPGLDPGLVDRVAARLADGAEWVTAATALNTSAWHSPQVVKVVVDGVSRALWFSRAPIGNADVALRHVGIYGWTTATLRRFATLPAHPLERAESLEQLRGLVAGLQLDVVHIQDAVGAVDTVQDLERLRREWQISR